jgi:hypothetical protein
LDRKHCAVVIVFLLIAAYGIPITAQDITGAMSFSLVSDQRNKENHSLSGDGWFSLDSVIVISWSGNATHTPLVPGGAPRIVNLTITYTTILSYPLIGKIIRYYCMVTHQVVTVVLELGEIPSWSTASLSASEIQFPVSDAISSQNVSLSIAIDEHAPAYALCVIPIHAEVKTLRGPLGFIPLVNGCDQTATVTCLPGYLPHIIIEPESDHLDVIPGEMSHLYFNVINHGNARTLVKMEIVDSPGNDWNVLVTDQIVLEEDGGNNFAFLYVTPPFGFSGADTITVSFTPYMYDNMSQHGAPVNVTTTVIYEP